MFYKLGQPLRYAHKPLIVSNKPANENGIADKMHTTGDTLKFADDQRRNAPTSCFINPYTFLYPVKIYERPVK